MHKRGKIQEAWSRRACTTRSRNLPDGRVLVVGGYNGGVLSGCELYHPAIGTWSSTGNLATPLYLPTVTLLQNGKVLVAGGYMVLCRLNDASAVLHRIVRIRKQGNCGFALQTKGDGLGAPDLAISGHEVLGKICAIERKKPAGRCRVNDMESKLRQITNFQLTWISLAKPRFPVVSRLVQKILSF
jgi:hypothetical protein